MGRSCTPTVANSIPVVRLLIRRHQLAQFVKFTQQSNTCAAEPGLCSGTQSLLYSMRRSVIDLMGASGADTSSAATTLCLVRVSTSSSI